ncbi:uncharacterized protein [Cherax quadricarinatus]
MCGVLLVLWQVPRPHATSTSLHHLSPPVHAPFPTSHAHISNPRYLQVLEGSSSGSQHLGDPAVSTTISDEGSSSSNPRLSGPLRDATVGQGSAAPAHSHLLQGWFKIPWHPVGHAAHLGHHHSIRHFNSSYVPEFNVENLKAPVKTRLRYKERRKQERLGSNTKNNKEFNKNLKEDSHKTSRERSSLKDFDTGVHSNGKEKISVITQDYKFVNEPLGYVMRNSDHDHRNDENESVKQYNSDEEDNYSERQSENRRGVYTVTSSHASFLMYNTKSTYNITPSEASALVYNSTGHMYNLTPVSDSFLENNSTRGMNVTSANISFLVYNNTRGTYNVTPTDATILVYNRIPKCASSTMQTIIRRLSRHLGFDHVSSLIYDKRQLSQDDQEQLIENLTSSVKGTPSHALSYDRHIYYTNFTALNAGRPVYINIIRDPVERFISSFYYRRSEERRNRILARGYPTLFSPSWVNRTVEQCVMHHDAECLFLPGEEKETTVTFFCGHHTFCRILGHPDALQVAKKVVSEEYSVVGLVNQMDISLLLMEALVPRYLTGALKVYDKIRHQEHIIVNQNQKKPEVPISTRQELLRRMADDVDFYNFLQQRLYEQKQTFLSRQNI